MNTDELFEKLTIIVFFVNKQQKTNIEEVLQNNMNKNSINDKRSGSIDFSKEQSDEFNISETLHSKIYSDKKINLLKSERSNIDQIISTKIDKIHNCDFSLHSSLPIKNINNVLKQDNEWDEDDGEKFNKNRNMPKKNDLLFANKNFIENNNNSISFENLEKIKSELLKICMESIDKEKETSRATFEIMSKDKDEKTEKILDKMEQKHNEDIFKLNSKLEKWQIEQNNQINDVKTKFLEVQFIKFLGK